MKCERTGCQGVEACPSVCDRLWLPLSVSCSRGASRQKGRVMKCEWAPIGGAG
jgi:hypothetical protein